jgi:hypothetical protein
MSRRPGLFNEALAGFFRSTAAAARKRAEEYANAGASGSLDAGPTPAFHEPPALSVPVEPDDQTDVDWLAESSR